MTSKIILDDGVTELTGIKSVTYTETVNSGTDLRPGCVGSACISVDMFGTQANAIPAGSKLYYYQVNDGVSTLIGQFYAEPSITTKQTYRFVAYDVVSMLDVDFSTWLSSHQEDFPMTIYSLVSVACSVAGVTLGSASWPLSTQSVNAFYADNLTCRNILEYAAEIACRFVRANTSNQIVFDWYTTNNSKSIRPGATQSGYIAYKQDGMNYENYTTETLDRVAIYPGGSDNAAFIYPTDASTGNTLSINGNLLLTNALDTTYIAVAQNIYTTLSALGTYRPMSVNLFPGENPFRAGEKVTVVDSQNVSFTTLIMNMTVTPSDATLSSTGAETYTGYGDNTGRTIANLSNVGSSLGKYVGAHLSMTSDGLYIISDNTSWRVLIKNDCVQILDDSDNVVAEYGTTVQIGLTGQSNIKIDSRSFKLVDKDGHTFLEARDLRDASGIAEIVDYFVGDGNNTIFYLSDTPIGSVSVTIDNVATSAYTITDSVLRFNQAPGTGAEIRVAFNGDSMSLVEMTFGLRDDSYPVGATSFTVGYGNAATGAYTSAFGLDTRAHGDYSIAEGSNTVALGYASHAEGTLTNASGDSSHSEGRASNASGVYSHAQNYGTDASGFAQTALGRYNASDPSGNYAVIIGNGSSNSSRSNALTVDWSGNVNATGNVTANGININSKIGTTTLPTTAQTLTGAIAELDGNIAAIKETTVLSSVPTSYNSNYVLKYLNKQIYPGNYASCSFIVITQTSATVNRSGIFSVTIGADSSSCAYELLAGSNPAHDLGFTASGTLYIKSLTSSAVNAYVTVIKTR